MTNSNTHHTPLWLPANLDALNRRFEQRSAPDIIRWGLAVFGDASAVTTGFGASGVVMLHIIATLRQQTRAVYVDTDLFFPETLALRDRLQERLGIRIEPLHSGLSLGEQAYQFGPELWRRAPDLCCHLRKVVPLRRYMQDKKAWFTALRRDQSVTRAATPVISWDRQYDVVKLCPLATWTRAEVWRYLLEHDLPYNPLHDAGYPSIGCTPCTRHAAADDGERAGRWAGSAKVECGIHQPPVWEVS